MNNTSKKYSVRDSSGHVFSAHNDLHVAAVALEFYAAQTLRAHILAGQRRTCPSSVVILENGLVVDSEVLDNVKKTEAYAALRSKYFSH